MSQQLCICPPRIAAFMAALLCSACVMAASTQPAAVEATPTAVPSATEAPAPESWRIDAGDRTLKAVLTRWTTRAGWQLVWELPADYSVEARAEFNGEFEDAVGTLARSLEHSQAPMKAILYRGNKVLRIVAKGAK